MTQIRVTPRPPSFAAIQYTGENEDAVAAFVGFLFQRAANGSPPAIYDPVGQWLRPLEAGSWVVLVGTSHNVLTDAEFQTAYMPA